MSDAVSVKVLDDLVEKIFKLKAEIEERNAATTELNKELMSLQSQAVGYLKELDRKSYKTAAGQITRKEMWRFSLPATLAEKKAMFKYFKDSGGEDLLYRMATVNSNSYNAFCKAEFEQAQERGDGMEYRGPGGTEAKLHETVELRKGK